MARSSETGDSVFELHRRTPLPFGLNGRSNSGARAAVSKLVAGPPACEPAGGILLYQFSKFAWVQPNTAALVTSLDHNFLKLYFYKHPCTTRTTHR